MILFDDTFFKINKQKDNHGLKYEIRAQNVQVPLAIFKREKEVARRVEFDGLYIAETPEEDDVKAHWDKIVISAKTFPVNYWDKFVKKKVRQKYSETYDFDYISNLLGMEKTSFSQQEEERTGLIHL